MPTFLNASFRCMISRLNIFLTRALSLERLFFKKGSNYKQLKMILTRNYHHLINQIF